MFMPDYEKWSANIISVTVPLFLYIWTNKRKARKAQEKKDAALEAERMFLPAHRHDEKSGPLHFDRLTYTPKPDGH